MLHSPGVETKSSQITVRICLEKLELILKREKRGFKRHNAFQHKLTRMETFMHSWNCNRVMASFMALTNWTDLQIDSKHRNWKELQLTDHCILQDTEWCNLQVKDGVSCQPRRMHQGQFRHMQNLWWREYSRRWHKHYPEGKEIKLRENLLAQHANITCITLMPCAKSVNCPMVRP